MNIINIPSGPFDGVAGDASIIEEAKQAGVNSPSVEPKTTPPIVEQEQTMATPSV